MHLGVINPQIATSFGAAFVALTVLFIRMRASRKPTSIAKIIMPPIGMSSGFLMFLYEPARIPLMWALFAFLAGVVLFSYPLIHTSKFHVVDGKVYLKRSKSFVFILFGLLAIRMILHNYVEEFISIPQTGALFFILAFGMLLPWRLAMLAQFMKLRVKP